MSTPQPYNFQIGVVYSFNSLAAAILGAEFVNVKLVAILDYDTAMQFSNVALMNKQILPLLPVGTPADPTAYTYLKFKTPVGTNIILAYNWIDTSTITITAGTTITVVVNNASTADVTTIKNVLAQLGYTNFSVTAT